MNVAYEDVVRFLYQEARLLDNRQWREWLELLDEQVVYRMPQRVTRDNPASPELVDAIQFLDETKRSLTTRVERLLTTSAWSETPRSRTRHFISNVMVDPGSEPGTVQVTCNFLLLRSRRDLVGVEQIFGERQDVLKLGEAGWRILRRTIIPDQTVMDIPNISVFF